MVISNRCGYGHRFLKNIIPIHIALQIHIVYPETTITLIFNQIKIEMQYATDCIVHKRCWLGHFALYQMTQLSIRFRRDNSPKYREILIAKM